MMVVGVETEYAVLAVGADVSAEVASELVVRAVAGATGPEVSLAAATLGPDDLSANRMLGNGARCYVDHAHPEYSTPEVTTLADLVAHDMAGDAIMLAAARDASARTGIDLRLYRNNTDGKGSSYGRHENYLVPRALDFERIAAAFGSFLVARGPLVGAGRVGIGQDGEVAGFQVSQRADFFATRRGLQTTHDRPIVNTRDEPHATGDRWRRLHVITADAARCEAQTWLTVGTAALVLKAIEADACPVVAWDDPVRAMQAFSHDPTLRRSAPAAGRDLSALDALEMVAQACAAFVSGHPDAIGPETSAVVEAWLTIVDDLRRDPASAADRLDWVAKLALLDAYRDRTGATWDDPRLAALDLVWADLDPARSPAAALQRRGRLARATTDAGLCAATTEPPVTTRAFLRGRLISRFGDAIVAPGWEDVTVRRASGRYVHVRMSEPLAHTRADVGALIDAAATVDELLAGLG